MANATTKVNKACFHGPSLFYHADTQPQNSVHEAVRLPLAPLFVHQLGRIKPSNAQGHENMTSPSPTMPTWRKAIGPLVLMSLLGLGYILGLHHYLTLESIAQNRAALAAYTAQHLALSLLAFAVVYTLAVAVSFPGASILTILAGLLFGWLLGGIAAIVAATIGATIVFQITKSSFGDVLAKKAGPFLSRISKGFEDDAFNYLLFLRLVPAFPFWLVNIAPALAKVKLRTFVTTTVLGIIPGTFAFASIGAGLDSVITAQQAANAQCVAEKSVAECPFGLSLSSLITTELLLAFAALGVVALIPVALKKWKAHHVV
jgi:uncharacterized membrane protein YdjX (TVP38/TMEM64 family)